MLFEMSLSQAALAKLFGGRFSPLEQVCFPPPAVVTGSPQFNRIDLHGAPTFAPATGAGSITLPDGSLYYLPVGRLRITQQFDIYGFVAVQAGDVIDAVQTVGPVSGFLTMSVRLQLANGAASLCPEFESLTLPPLISSEQAQAATDTATALLQQPCTPVPIGDLLNQLTSQMPGGQSLFASTAVLNAGLVVGPEGALRIRVELDTIDADAMDRWKAFYQGTDTPVLVAAVIDANTPPPPPPDWMVTIDRRVFTKLVTQLVAGIEADSHQDGTPGHLDLSKPAVSWHVSQDLWGFQFPVAKKIADGLPTLTAEIDGTAVDVCPGVGGATDIDFTADVTVAFDVPSEDTLRIYAGVGIDASDWDQFKCGVNLAVTFSAPLIPIMGPFGLIAGAFLAIVVLSLSGGTAGNFTFDKQCHEEYGLQVCDYPWTTGATTFGTLHLTGVLGLKQGLVLLGSLIPSPSAAIPVLSWKVAKNFSWHPISCAPIEQETDYRAEVWVQITEPFICDARIVNDPDNAYQAVIQPGARTVRVFCMKPPSLLPTYMCRVLVATTRGVFLAKIPAPSADVPLEQLKQEQQIMCMEQHTAIDNSNYKDWTKFPVDPGEADPIEIISPDLSLVVLEVTVGGLGSGQVAHLQADGHVIAKATPGPLGFAGLLGAVGAESVSAQFSVTTTGRRQIAPLTRPLIDAHLELWRGAGKSSVVGEVRDIALADGESCWVATTHGVLRFGLHADTPVLLDHIPRTGVQQLLLTQYGVFTGGIDGVGVLEEDRREVRMLREIRGVYALARRGSTLFAIGERSIHRFHVGWMQDARGRTRALAFRQTEELKAQDARAALLTAHFLVLAGADALHVDELQRNGTLTTGGSIPVPGLRNIHAAVGADMHDAIVAELDDRVALIRVETALANPRTFEMLDLPGLPWFAGTQRRRSVVVRRRSTQSGIEVYKLAQRIDLGRREASVRSARGAR